MSEQRLFRIVADDIRAKIMSGIFQPGSRLPGERKLARQFDVSRIVIRQAEIHLEALGLVEFRVGAGVFVKSRDRAIRCDLPLASAIELLECRSLFETEVVAIAAHEVSDGQLAALERTINRLVKARPGSLERREADRDFHLTIAKASGNAVNVFILERLWRLYDEIPEVRQEHSAICKTYHLRRVNDFIAIVSALRERCPLHARVAMKTHFTGLIDAILAASEQRFIEQIHSRAQAARKSSQYVDLMRMAYASGR